MDVNFLNTIKNRNKESDETKETKSESQTASSQEQYRFLSEEIVELLNFRIIEEEKSSRIYLAISLWFQDKAYFNLAKLYKKYSEEELKHGDKAREFLLSFNILPETRPIPNVSNDFLSVSDIIDKTLEHEALVTQQSKDLAKAALAEQDFLTFNLAQFYLSEQVEEMNKVWDLKNHLESFGTDKIALKLFDEFVETYL